MSDTIKLASLTGKSVPDLVEFIDESAKIAQSAAVRTAKGIIALIAVSGSEKLAREAMKKGGIADCTVKNAMQLVWAYDDVVRPGFADEDWFDGLLYLHAVAVRRAVAKVTGGAKTLHEWGLFKKTAKANLVEFELVGDTGLNRAQRIEAAQKKADAEIAAKTKLSDNKIETSAKSAPPATPAEVASLETPKPGKGKPTTLAEFDTLVNGVEKFVAAVIPTADEVTVETMKNRVAALVVKLDAAVKARAEASRKAAA